MTLETANRIVLEQGEKTNKEARAVVRGGMVICELTVDGRRTYPWIKVYPTKTDNESSIEQALEMRHAKKTSPSMKILSKQEPVLVPSKEPEVVPVQVPEEKSTIEEKSFSIYSLISKGKQKLLELYYSPIPNQCPYVAKAIAAALQLRKADNRQCDPESFLG